MTDIANVSVKIEADLKRLDTSLKQAEQIVKRAAQKVDAPFQTVASSLVKAFAAIGTIEAGLRGAVGVAQLFKGEASEALDNFERMPFGIGAVVGASRDLYEELSGVADKQREINRLVNQAADARRREAEVVAGIRKRQELPKSLADATRRLKDDADLTTARLTLPSDDVARLELQQKQFGRRQAVEAEIVRAQLEAASRGPAEAANILKQAAAAEAELRRLEQAERTTLAMKVYEAERKYDEALHQKKLRQDQERLEKIRQMFRRLDAEQARRNRVIARKFNDRLGSHVAGLNEDAGIRGGAQFRAVEANRFSFARTATFNRPVQVELVRKSIVELMNTPGGNPFALGAL